MLTGAAAALVAVVAVRLGWELLVSPLARFLPGPHPAFVRNPWRQRLVIGWGGMRGAISLAIVLSMPTMLNGTVFTERPTLVFLAAIVVVATLIGQGLTLAPLLRVLGLAQSERRHRAEARARAKVTEAGLARLDQLAEAGGVDEDTASVYRQLFEMRLDRVRVTLGDASEDDVADTAGRAGSSSARNGTSSTSCTATARSATRPAAPSPAPSTCRNHGRSLQVDLAAHAGDGAAGDPDRAVVVAGDVDPPGPAQRGALAGHVRRAGPAGPQQPRRERGVEAAGDRVLDDAPVLGEERPDFERRRRPGRIGPGQAQVEVGVPGLTARTASALSSSTAIQPGPLSAQDASTMADRSIRSAAATCASSPPSTGPSRSTGGAAKASPSAPAAPAPGPPGTPARSRPAGGACRPRPARRGRCPAWDARRRAARRPG